MRTIEERLADYTNDLERATAPATDRPTLPRRDGRGRLMALVAVAAATVLVIAFVVQRTTQTPAGDRPGITPETSLSAGTAVPSSVAIAVGEPTVYEQWYNSIVEGETPTTLAARFGITVDALAARNGWADGAAHVLSVGDTVHIPGGALAVTEAMVMYVQQGDFGVGVSIDGHTICLLYATVISGCDSRQQGDALTVLNSDGSTTMALYGVATAPAVRLHDSTGTSLPLPVSDSINGLVAFISVALPLDFRGTFMALDGDTVVGTSTWAPADPSTDPSTCAYTVEQGDSPTRVAAMSGVTVEELNAANANTYGYINFVAGTVIVIPDCTPSATTG